MKRIAMLLLAAAMVLGPIASARGQIGLGGGLSGGLGGDSGSADPVTLTAKFVASDANRPAVLAIVADIAPGWHVYSLTQPAGGPTKTIIEVAPSPQYEVLGEFQGYPEPARHIDNEAWVGLTIEEHHGRVIWYAPIELAVGMDPATIAIHGKVRMLACKTNCIPVSKDFSARFDADRAANLPLDKLDVSASRSIREAPQATVATPRDGVEGAKSATSERAGAAIGPKYDLSRIVVKESTGSLGYYILLAFVGGIILNLMPCVLPVIGLKVMSFVQQSGHSRSRAFVLNLWYSVGIVSVFLLLGLLAASIGLSWGGQFGSLPFTVTIAAVVFAMALSLLGVWEIPIPGFFGSSAVQGVASREGPFGAFVKGAITTVLATPCTGPFMASAIAWAVTQTFSTILIVFGSLGLGMASPYLLIGVFPELLRFLPKPGAWMETFKQVTGFLLLGTVVFILSFMEPAAIVPTLVLLLGVAIACWLVARTPLTAAFVYRLRSQVIAGAVVLVTAVLAFGWLYTKDQRTDWQPFSLEALQQVAVEERRTVLVDFSADWCANCKVLEKAVLHTDRVKKAIADASAVTMYADYTDYPPEIERTILALKGNGVPVIAIFPGDRPYEPIVFRDGYTAQGLIAALARADGGSKDSGASPAVASASIN